MSDLTLVLGSRHLSSWSLRGWLALKHTGLAFREIVIELDRPGTAAEIRRYSPSGRVPVLLDGGLAIWDSLAIAEFLAEISTRVRLWPSKPESRAVARSACAEMHSGWAELRELLPMNLVTTPAHKPLTPTVERQVNRIVELWRDCRSRFGAGGPFLFGSFTLADAFYAPVATRFDTYRTPLPTDAAAYVSTLLALPAMREWYAAARAAAGA